MFAFSYIIILLKAVYYTSFLVLFRAISSQQDYDNIHWFFEEDVTISPTAISQIVISQYSFPKKLGWDAFGLGWWKADNRSDQLQRSQLRVRLLDMFCEMSQNFDGSMTSHGFYCFCFLLIQRRPNTTYVCVGSPPPPPLALHFRMKPT